jgi:hypothetical protein
VAMGTSNELNLFSLCIGVILFLLDEKKMNIEFLKSFLRVHLPESPPPKDPHSTLGLGIGIFKQASKQSNAFRELQLQICWILFFLFSKGDEMHIFKLYIYICIWRE